MVDALAALSVWLGFALLVIGGVWFIIAAFQEGLLWGLGVLFVPFVPLVFLVLGWDRARRPFGFQLLGIGLVLFGVFVLSAPIPGVHHHRW